MAFFNQIACMTLELFGFFSIFADLRSLGSEMPHRSFPYIVKEVHWHN